MSDAITFARSLYEPDAVRAAVDAFADLAKLEIESTEHDIVVRIADADPEVGHLSDELANYALVETVTRRAGAGAAR